jgi:hypothetical protein
MTYEKNETWSLAGGALVVLAVFASMIGLVAWTDRSLDYWCETDVDLSVSVFLVLTGPVSLGANVFSEVVRLFA